MYIQLSNQFAILNAPGITILFGVSNCYKFYFTYKFEVQMWVQIYQIFERYRISICYLSNKSNLNTDKPKDFLIRPNIYKY
jgi:hypothetical protein